MKPPLSFAQARMWFFDRLEPDSPLYNVPLVIRLAGAIDVTALERSLTEIVRRHEVLRTRYPADEGVPWQDVLPAQPVTLGFVDLRTEAPANRDRRLAEQVRTESRRPFDLGRSLPFRATLVRLESEAHVLLLVIHHIAVDGWSVEVLLRELGALYKAFAAGLSSPLDELPIQYRDYAHAQRTRLRGEGLDRQLDFWRTRLADAPPLLPLPTDRPRPAVQRHVGGQVSVPMPPDLLSCLGALARRERATLFMVLLAGYKALLYRSTGTTDIIVGIPTAGRLDSELEHLVGCFANTVVMRTDLAGDPSFLELIRRVRETALDAFDHQELPFERLVEELQPARNLSYHPLFQVLFNFRNFAPPPVDDSPAMWLESRLDERQTALVDLSIAFTNGPEGWGCDLRYNTDLFERETVAALAERYRILLAGAVDNPERRLSELPLLRPAERERLLTEWNATETRFAETGCLHQRFEAQAARTPTAPALAGGPERLTYSELDRRANQLAHFLRGLGVKPESRVGICLERSVDMAAGVIGVLKAGGAYVPLDPAHPPERLKLLLANAGAGIVLCEQSLRSAFAPATSSVISLQEVREALTREPADEPPVSPVVEENLAYVMYTSGSTGTPKAVMITHGAAVNHLEWRQSFFPLGPGDRLLQTASLGFDDSVWELFEAWLSGAEVVLAPPDAQRDPRRLAELIADEGVTAICLVPSVLEGLLDAPALGRCGALRRVTTGGEALSPELRDRCLTRLAAQLYNGYGPTEATIAATFSQCRGDQGSPRVAIGRPIANTEVYLLDRNLEPVPPGFVGEVFIGGAGLARGYLGAPGSTAAVFLPDRWSGHPGARLYRTGDIARQRFDGVLEFVGRTDDQVKIRGIRVDAAEAGALLATHPAVAGAAVVPRREPSGAPRLVGYVVPRDGRQPTTLELRTFLKERLPEVMIPGAFVLMDALPRTLSGKLDRAALPDPDQNGSRAERTLVAPRTPLESLLADIWKEVLGVEQVSVHDDFFTLGGHSLRAAQVVARVEDALNIELPLRSMFENGTIDRLADYITRLGDT
jgi:amino acid adenylation domain-containing protein